MAPPASTLPDYSPKRGVEEPRPGRSSDASAAVTVAADQRLGDAGQVLADRVQPRVDGEGPAEATSGGGRLADGQVAEALTRGGPEVVRVQAEGLLAVGDGGGIVLGEVAGGGP